MEPLRTIGYERATYLILVAQTTYGTRFIAASNKCTTKPLSSLLTDCLTSDISENIVVVFLGTLASVLLTMLSLFYILCKHLTTLRGQEVRIHFISPRFILVYLMFP